jgi:hypothetical protein
MSVRVASVVAVVAEAVALPADAALSNALRILVYAGFLFKLLSNKQASPSPGN